MASNPGFMIPLNERDSSFPFDNGTRNICDPQIQAKFTGAPWWTCENIQFTETLDAVTARVGDKVVIQVGAQGLPGSDGATPALVQNVQAWVCYPNTVPGQANTALVVPSMTNNAFAFFSDLTENAPIVFGDGTYQDTDAAFAWISLSPWTPTMEDFLDQGGGGHCCIIANAAGIADADLEARPPSGDPVGTVITDNSQLNTTINHPGINVCSSLYQAQRNVVIVPAQQGQISHGFAFLSGLPRHERASTTTVSVTALDQGEKIDPILLKVLAGGPYAGMPLKAASTPPKSLRLARHDHRWNGWLCRIIHEAEEILEEIFAHSFGSGHKLHLTLPPKGLQPLRVTAELDPSDAAGTVHSLEITQTDTNGVQGGIRVGIVVT
jgi:hypothetical protein